MFVQGMLCIALIMSVLTLATISLTIMHFFNRYVVAIIGSAFLLEVLASKSNDSDHSWSTAKALILLQRFHCLSVGLSSVLCIRTDRGWCTPTTTTWIGPSISQYSPRFFISSLRSSCYMKRSKRGNGSKSWQTWSITCNQGSDRCHSYLDYRSRQSSLKICRILSLISNPKCIPCFTSPNRFELHSKWTEFNWTALYPNALYCIYINGRPTHYFILL